MIYHGGPKELIYEGIIAKPRRICALYGRPSDSAQTLDGLCLSHIRHIFSYESVTEVVVGPEDEIASSNDNIELLLGR